MSASKSYFQSSPSARASRGFLLRGSVVRVVGRSADGKWAQIEVRKGSGEIVVGYVKLVDLEVGIDAPHIQIPAGGRRPPRRTGDADGDGEPEVDEPYRRWSFGAGFSGTSRPGGTTLVVGGELRYLWTREFESIFGIDLAFGSDPAIGARYAQRFYFPVSKKFRPYLHAGVRVGDLSDWRSSAFDPGFGFQVTLRGGSYFDVGVNYLIATPFNSNGENYWTFGGSSGVRF